MSDSQNFQVNLRGVIELLSGHLYSGPQVYLRELLQNSVDALIARTASEPDHVPEISFEVTESAAGPTLLVRDNGIGLSEDEVHEFLATIGQSSKRDPLTRDTFIGQFGIGLLSGFMVCDEIVVITRSIRPDAQPVEWKGRADGTYTVRTLEHDFDPGTQVFLRAKPGSHEFLEPDFVLQMVRHYGHFLPMPVSVSAGGSTTEVNDPPPWEQEFDSEDERQQSWLQFAQDTFAAPFLDVIPIETESGGVRGLAFVQLHASNTAVRQSHRVYLKNMLLSEQADKLLPEWAFFVRCVLNVSDLKPTASREALQDDMYLADARASIGDEIRQWLMDLAQSDRERLDRIIAVHYLSMKGLAVDDDSFFRMFIDWLPFETSLGHLTLGEVLERSDTVRFVGTRDQFRQISGVAASQNMCIVNAGYVHDTELLYKLQHLFPDRRVEEVDISELTQNFEDLTLEERDTVFEFLKVADEALEPFRTRAEIRRFDPADLPTLYTANEDATFMRSIEQTQEKTDELWSGVLDGIAEVPGQTGWSQLCFNFNNQLVKRLSGLKNAELIRRSVEMLYVQSLLLGHYPLRSSEMALLSDGLRGLIEFSVGVGEQDE